MTKITQKPKSPKAKSIGPKGTKGTKGTKGSKKTARLSKKDGHKAAVELASCVVWALKFMTAPGNGCVVNLNEGLSFGKSQPWQDKFFDALELVGLRYNRKAYYKSKRR